MRVHLGAGVHMGLYSTGQEEHEVSRLEKIWTENTCREQSNAYVIMHLFDFC